MTPAAWLYIKSSSPRFRVSSINLLLIAFDDSIANIQQIQAFCRHFKGRTVKRSSEYGSLKRFCKRKISSFLFEFKF